MNKKINITKPIIKIVLLTVALTILVLTPGFLYHYLVKGQSLGNALLFSMIYTVISLTTIVIIIPFATDILNKKMKKN